MGKKKVWNNYLLNLFIINTNVTGLWKKLRELKNLTRRHSNHHNPVAWDSTKNKLNIKISIKLGVWFRHSVSSLHYSEAVFQRCSYKKAFWNLHMQQIYMRTPMPKSDFNKVTKQLYWNHSLAWVLSCKFAAYSQQTFSYERL